MHWSRVIKPLLDPLYRVKRDTVELDGLGDLMTLMRWNRLPVMVEDDLDEVSNATDANNRRRLDAEVLSCAARNIEPAICLDIGDPYGRSAARIAVNATQSQVYTINLPPEEMPQSGSLSAELPDREEIGSYYREKNLTNITQIYANTKTWEPQIKGVELGFVGGSHDKDSVYGDTVKLLSIANPEKCFVLWHNFNLTLIDRYDWIEESMRGVEQLLRRGILAGPIYHVRNSWIGICDVRKTP